MKHNKKAFTLVELLVVVLIIGVLTSIAIPMYQGAVDKSHWSTLLTPAKALQTAQAAAYMENGSYAEDASALSVSLPGETDDNKFITSDAQYSIDTKSASQSTITGQSTALPNVKLSMFLKNPDSYLFCDAKTGDARAERLCEKLLGGTKASTKDGYTKYILDYPGACAWANTTGQCYTSEEARCTAMGMPYSGGFCGYTDAYYGNTQINEGGICKSVGGSCHGVIVNDGGICDGRYVQSGSWAACYSSTINSGGICWAGHSSGVTQGCMNIVVNEGGQCIADSSGGCLNMRKNEGICIANAQNTCTGTYSGKGCCEDYGKGFCPADAPKC